MAQENTKVKTFTLPYSSDNYRKRQTEGTSSQEKGKNLQEEKNQNWKGITGKGKSNKKGKTSNQVLTKINKERETVASSASKTTMENEEKQEKAGKTAAENQDKWEKEVGFDTKSFEEKGQVGDETRP